MNSEVRDDFLGIVLFLFPYFMEYLIIFRIKSLQKHFVYVAFPLATCICFFITFLAQYDRDVFDIFHHITYPTVKFYIQYYGFMFFMILLLSVTFVVVQNAKIKFFCSKKAVRIANLILIPLTIFNITSVIWASNNFPINSPQTVFFVLNSPIDGGVNTSIIIKAIFYIIIPIIVICAGAVYVSKRKPILFSNIYILIGYMFIFSCMFFIMRTKIYAYPPLIYSSLQKPVVSEFYQKEYVYPSSVTIQFPEKKRNCILILLESMESSFADQQSGGLLEENLIPHLTQLAAQNINFSGTDMLGGGIDLDGTGWTIAAMFAKMAGLPFNPIFLPHNPSEITSFFPNVVTLTDILAWNGYAQRFLFGSKKEFASRDIFFESHGNVEIHDINWYKKENLLPQDYDNHFWGLEDEKLYMYAREELRNLSVNDSPFFLGILTVDTHMPNGYICDLCTVEHPESPIKDAISCADRQIADFIAWCKEQSFMENTTIIILGDHLFMSTASSHLFPDGNDTAITYNSEGGVMGTIDTPRRWINIFINSAIEPTQMKNRLFSSFDMFPTILESLGATIDHHALGFGRSLFSNIPTLLEQYPIPFINTELMKKTTEYMHLLY